MFFVLFMVTFSLRFISAVAVSEFGDEFRLGVDVEEPEDFLHVAVEGVWGELQVCGDLLAGLPFEEEVEGDALAGGEAGDGGAEIVGEDGIMQPWHLAKDDVCDPGFPRRERQGAGSAIDANL